MVINEVQANPQQDDEWVELYAFPESPAASGSGSIALSGWSLWELVKKPAILHTFKQETITTGEVLVVPVSGLNNGQDGVVLKDYRNQESDRFEYQQTNKATTWSRLPDGTGQFVQAKPSKNALNSLINPINPTPTPEADSGSNPQLDTEEKQPQPSDNPSSEEAAPQTASSQAAGQPADSGSRSAPELEPLLAEKLNRYALLDEELNRKFIQQQFQLTASTAGSPSNSTIYFQHKTAFKPAVLSVIIGGIIWIGLGFYLYVKINR